MSTLILVIAAIIIALAMSLVKLFPCDYPISLLFVRRLPLLLSGIARGAAAPGNLHNVDEDENVELIDLLPSLT